VFRPGSIRRPVAPHDPLAPKREEEIGSKQKRSSAKCEENFRLFHFCNRWIVMQ
jgi:hypothetical protein